jgi:hypothetical protein
LVGMSVSIEPKSNMADSKHKIVIQIGSVCCAIKCSDDEIYHRLQQLYHDFLTEKTADIMVELKWTDQLSIDDLSEAVSETRFIHEGNRFRTTSQIIAGQYDLSQQSIIITGEKNLADPDQEFNHLNQLMSLIYYSACKVKYDGSPPPALLVHACGISRYGQVIAFAGPSEAGKSTIAGLCGDKHGKVLNDEMLLLSRPTPDSREIIAQSAPIVSRFSPRHKISAPLGCILLLKKSHRTLYRYLDKTEAYLHFIRQIISPAHIGQRSRRDVYSLMADFSAEVTKTVPIYELEFNLDAESLWQSVMELEEILGRKSW